jgi:hypothetical protein
VFKYSYSRDETDVMQWFVFLGIRNVCEINELTAWNVPRIGTLSIVVWVYR